MLDWLFGGRKSSSAGNESTTKRQGRPVYSLQLHFITNRGPFGDLIKLLNTYCRDTVGDSADFLLLSGEGNSQTATKLMAHQRGWQPTWLAAVQTKICLVENCNWPLGTTVQFQNFEGASLEKLEQEVNAFCTKHEASKIQVKRISKDLTVAIVTYRVAA